MVIIIIFAVKYNLYRHEWYPEHSKQDIWDTRSASDAGLRFGGIISGNYRQPEQSGEKKYQKISTWLYVSAHQRRVCFLKQSLIFQNGITNEELKKAKGILRTGRGGVRQLPYAFTEQGLAMLSGILNSDIAIDVNISIMRAFVAIRHMASSLPNTAAEVAQLRKDFEDLKLDIEDILHDQNEINEDTRAQLDATSTALAELQPKDPKPHRKIGFVQEEEEVKYGRSSHKSGGWYCDWYEVGWWGIYGVLESERNMDNRLQNALNLCNNNKFEEVLILLEEVIKVDRRSKTSRTS